MRWIGNVLGLTLMLATLQGCTQQCFVSECDIKSYQRIMPQNLETTPDAGAYQPIAYSRPVSTVADPERKKRYMSLAECISIALENGTTGIQSVRQLGSITDDLLTFVQLQSLEQQSDSIRVLSILPAEFGAGIDAALARWDPRWVNSFVSTETDQPVQGLGSFSNGNSTTALTSLVKPLPTGGLAGITFSTTYTNLANPPKGFQIINPAYTPQLQFTFDHPLFQSFGTDINQLLPRNPLVSTSSLVNPLASQALNNQTATLAQGIGSAASGFGFTGILVTRLRFDQSRADLERLVNFQILNVEVAYWNLYAAYVNLYSSEQALRQAHEAWFIAKVRFEIGNGQITDYASTRGQYEQFRGDRIQALGRVLEAERVLRRLMGLPIEDGCQIVPIDTPTVAPYVPDWCTALNEALTLRPELVANRAELKARQFDVLVQKNYLKPDLRFVSAYAVNGIGGSIAGGASGTQVFDSTTGQNRSNDAFANLASDHYNNWTLGLTMTMPLGFRYEHAAVRRARLALAQVYIGLKNEEAKATAFLSKAYRDVTENYKVIEARRAQRLAYAEQVEARFQQFRVGKITAEFLLEAQRQWANALSLEYQAIVSYNNSLATFEFAKGTIMAHDNVQIGEGPLPQCVQIRAVEHEKERSKALVLRERAKPIAHAKMDLEHGTSGLPQLPAQTAMGLASLDAGTEQMNGGPGGNQSAANNLSSALPAAPTRPAVQTVPPTFTPSDSQPEVLELQQPRPSGNTFPSTPVAPPVLPQPVVPTSPSQSPVPGRSQGTSQQDEMQLVPLN